MENADGIRRKGTRHGEARIESAGKERDMVRRGWNPLGRDRTFLGEERNMMKKRDIIRGLVWDM